VIITAAATVGTSAGNPMDVFNVLGFFTLGFGLILMLPLAMMLPNGWSLLRKPASPVSSVTKGRVVVSGIVEPAWSVVKSPFADLACVWYDDSSYVSGKFGYLVSEEINAVPFVLNDGTGRILVLARRARWDPTYTSRSAWVGAGRARAPQDGASDVEIAGMLDRPLAPAPPSLKSFQKDGCEPWSGSRGSSCVPVGRRVTVTGVAIHFMMAGVDERDACPDDGSSLGLGLGGGYVMAPDELVVLAGSAGALTRRFRIAMVLAPVGAVLAIAGVVMLRVA
jgi:hypothetical protein